jgi:hypothetical protein
MVGRAAAVPAGSGALAVEGFACSQPKSPSSERRRTTGGRERVMVRI